MTLKIVKDGWSLLWPETFPRNKRYRGGPGYVVDTEAPLEDQWLKGQAHKLADAPDGLHATPIEETLAIEALIAAGFKAERPRRKTRAEQMAENQEAARAAGEAPEIYADGLEARPTRSVERRDGRYSTGVAQRAMLRSKQREAERAAARARRREEAVSPATEPKAEPAAKTSTTRRSRKQKAEEAFDAGQ